MEGVTSFTFHGSTRYPVIALLAAIAETVLILAAASAIFGRKDIAVSIE
jgi:hypothetical protein